MPSCYIGYNMGVEPHESKTLFEVNKKNLECQYIVLTEYKKSLPIQKRV